MKYTILIFALVCTCMITQMAPAQNASPDSTIKKPAATLDEAALEAELRKEMGQDADSISEQLPPAQQPVRPGLPLNPRISVVGSFFANGTAPGDAVVKNADLGLNEAEIAFNATVDPYVRADFFVALRNEAEDPFAGPDSGAAANGDYETELEEAFLTTLSLPYGLQVKAGKFRSNFGRINQIHPHALNYIDMPRMYVNYLGSEGLADQGLAVNWLLPLNFFSEFSVEITSGKVESPSFEGGGNDLLYLGHFTNFFDLNRNTTLEVGLTGVYGANSSHGNKSAIAAGDVTLKWKPLRRGRYKSFEWTTEALLSRRDTGAEKVNSAALYSFMRYQLGRRWFIGGRYDYSEFPENGSIHETAYTATLGFFATEFQKIELQFQHGRPAEIDSFNRLMLRAIFVIGAHGAHQY